VHILAADLSEEMKLLASLLVLPRLGSSTFNLPAPGSAAPKPSLPSTALALSPAAGNVSEEAAPAFFQQGSSQHPSPSCQWMVHYDEWQPSFEHGVYRWRAQHASCLEACCHDPSCTGLQLTSGLDSQCYKYSHVPAQLAGRREEARPMGDGRWLAEAPSRWSVFVKATHGLLPGPPGEHFVPSARERTREADEAEGLKYAEKALASVTRNGVPMTTCNWTVHYGLWTTSFDDGEYEPNNARGGVHCLDACCNDPGCHGLALESLEKYQCYKYSSLPQHMQGGRALGDGQWLRQMPMKWSVFVKHGVAMTPPVPQLPPLEAASERRLEHSSGVHAAARSAPVPRQEATHASPPLFTPLLSCIAVGALAMYVNYYFSSDEILRRLKAKTLRLGLEGHLKQEGRELMPRAL